MPVSLKRIRETGTLVFLHTCEVCGADARFGEGVAFALAMERLEEKDSAGAKKHLGKWYCGEHRPAKEAG